MPNFIRFADGDGTTINLEHLSSISRGKRIASQSDVEKRPELWTEGQNIYYIRYTIIGDSKTTMEYISKQFRDQCYNEIIALIRPTIIGANPPADASTPSFGTPVTKAAEQSPIEAVTPTSPTPKPPRKPRTPRQ
jgi:hypothetical protein